MVELTQGVEVLARGEGEPVHGFEGRLEVSALSRQDRAHVKPRRRSKSHPLALALTDQANGDRLDPSGRARLVNGPPEYGRNLVTDQTVEEAPALLGVNQAKVQVAGLAHRLGDGARRDLVKDHPLDGHLGIEDLAQVPSNGFPLTVFVGGEVELVHLLERRL